MTTLYAETRVKPTVTKNALPVARSKIAPWTWMVVTCVMLGISGGVRFWRDYEFRALAEEYANCPFPLKDFPRELGNWRGVDGSDAQLDPLIARLAGSSDHLIRTYVDEKSGERVTALVLYGPALNVYGHSPEQCYPSTGFTALREPKDRSFSLPDGSGGGQYRYGYYVKRIGATTECTEVFHGFLYDGQWLASAADRWKSFRYHPGMFRVMLDRQIAGVPNEENTDNDLVMESLFRAIAGEITKAIQSSERTAPAVESVAKSGP
jgi:hypothetical protein